MVTALLSRAARAVHDDVAAFARQVSGRARDEGPPRGLCTYRFALDGGHTRLHLRVQEDGTGLLFRDVTDVLHLSSTAAELAWMVLEQWDEPRALAWLARRYRAPRDTFRGDYAQMRRVVDTLTREDAGCHTCALDLPKMPLFSARALAPHKVDLALTYACNNRCPHCYNDPDRFDMRALSVDEWKRILDSLAEVGVPHVIFTGGEATVYKGLPELVAHADGLGMIVGLNSNGRRLANRAYVESLRDAGLNHVQITLESNRAEVHDAMVGARAFDECVAGIRMVRDVGGIHCITNTTITQVNRDHVDDTVRFLHELGLATFAMNGMIWSGGGDANPDAIFQEELPPILLLVRDTAEELGMRFLWYTVTEYCEMNPVELEIGAKRCNAGEYSMCIEPNGDVLPCQSYYVSAGNMLRDAWGDIWKGGSFRDRERDPAWAGLPDKCHTCPDLPLCGGGCRIEREAREGLAPSGCQSCASGGAAKSTKTTLRSSGASAARACTCDSGAHASGGCASDVHRHAPSGGLVQLRVPSAHAGEGRTA